MSKSDVAECFGDLGGELAKDAILRRFGELRERIGLIRRLSRPQPIVSFPITRLADDREDGQFVLLLEVSQAGEFLGEDVF